MGRRIKLGLPRPKVVPNREELAWAAGFFDGEGTTSAQRVKGNSYLRASVHQVFRPNLERFHAAIGYIGNITGPSIQPNRQPIYSWQTSKFEHAQATIAMLWSFLSEAKRDQYRKVLAAAQENPDFKLSYREKQSRHTTKRWQRVKDAAKLRQEKEL